GEEPGLWGEGAGEAGRQRLAPGSEDGPERRAITVEEPRRHHHRLQCQAGDEDGRRVDNVVAAAERGDGAAETDGAEPEESGGAEAEDGGERREDFASGLLRPGHQQDAGSGDEDGAREREGQRIAEEREAEDRDEHG